MDTLSYKTKSINKENAGKTWLVVDAKDQPLGRFSSKVAQLLRGKHKPNYTPHADCGDNVIVLNADKVTLSGNKWETKTYVRHTGYPGGQRTTLAKELLAKKPFALVEKSVKGMLPKTRLGRELYRNLYVYTGTDHPHEGQKPKEFNINSIK